MYEMYETKIRMTPIGILTITIAVGLHTITDEDGFEYDDVIDVQYIII